MSWLQVLHSQRINFPGQDMRCSAQLSFMHHAELPAVPARRLERPHPSAAWMSPYPAPEDEDPSFPQNAAEAVLGPNGAEDPRQVAKDDALAALLHMQVGALKHCNLFRPYSTQA